MSILFFAAILLFATVVLFLMPQKARAHCDTMDGPAVSDGKKALETENIPKNPKPEIF